MRRSGPYLAIALSAAWTGLSVELPDRARADDNAPAPQAAAEPPRRGLPPPLDSPPFPDSEWLLGGSQLIGVPDTAVGPLMKAIHETPPGQAWKDSRVKIYGWTELSFAVACPALHASMGLAA